MEGCRRPYSRKIGNRGVGTTILRNLWPEAEAPIIDT
ncbi:hypothetical protein CCACVL1_03513 [Corchorus capsularis]|uniref:Uncharacterized protein n=1 Tax=Corchorus capsularis TaxID=210143 RepID=A0A1R3JYU1_COCAP|nr:hypothetical protein CCACVL1_03513 [Corchorus capsularis]